MRGKPKQTMNLSLLLEQDSSQASHPKRRSSKRTSENRTEILALRLTPAEKEAIVKRAEEKGMSMSAYIMWCKGWADHLEKINTFMEGLKNDNQ